MPLLGKGCKFKIKYIKYGPRRIAQRALGLYILGSASPMPDTGHWLTILYGAVYRYARQVPDANVRLLRKWALWQRSFLYHHVNPLTSVMSFDEWLEKSHYSANRKQQLRDVYDRINGDQNSLYYALLEQMNVKASLVNSWMKFMSLPDFHIVSGFGKVETYYNLDSVYKMARGINPRGDAFMVVFGPLVSSIERAVFHNDDEHPNHISKYFIKQIPVKLRGRYLYERLKRDGARYAKSDHTSFEAHMTPKVWNNSERVLYEYMWKDVVHPLVRAVFYAVMTGINVIKYKCGVRLQVVGRRMSGDPNTSLGNGYINLVAGLFNSVMNGGDINDVDCVCEGDDGCFSWTKKGPTSKFYELLGFEVKFEEVDSIAEIGFCHLYFSEKEPDVAITDYRKVLLSFGWTHSKYKETSSKEVLKGLLRAKAMSLACEYPNCPVLGPLAKKALSLTETAKPLFDADAIAKHQRLNYNPLDYEEDTLGSVSETSRQEVADLFGLSVAQQLEIEDHIDKAQSWDQALNIDLQVPEAMWDDYFNTYFYNIALPDVAA